MCQIRKTNVMVFSNHTKSNIESSWYQYGSDLFEYIVRYMNRPQTQVETAS